MLRTDCGVRGVGRRQEDKMAASSRSCGHFLDVVRTRFPCRTKTKQKKVVAAFRSETVLPELRLMEPADGGRQGAALVAVDGKMIFIRRRKEQWTMLQQPRAHVSEVLSALTRVLDRKAYLSTFSSLSLYRIFRDRPGAWGYHRTAFFFFLRCRSRI